MGRLIDEQTVNEAVRKVLRKYGFSDELCVSDEIWDCIENEVPTAYDVEKVINQLSTKMFSAELHGDEWNGQTVDNLLCMGDVYEILKGGGVDE